MAQIIGGVNKCNGLAFGCEARVAQSTSKFTPLSSVDMEKISGGAYCLKGKADGAATGLCIVGGLLNPYVGVGCAVWGTYHYFAC